MINDNIIDFTNNSGGGGSPIAREFPTINCSYSDGLTIKSNGEVSGFYQISGRYPSCGVFLPNISTTDMADLEFQTAFKVTDNSYEIKEFGIFCIWADPSDATRSLLLDAYEGKLLCYYSYGGGIWETPFGDIDILDDTKYYIKLKIKDSTLTLSISSDGTTYTDYTETLTDSLAGGLPELGISAGTVATAAQDIIYINETKLYKADTLVFQGATI